MADTAPSPEDLRLAQFQQARQALADTHDAASSPDLDTSTGAGLWAGMAVGAAPQPKDELSTLKKYYPDARPVGDGNYVFTHPDTGKPTLYRPTEGTHPLNWASRNAQEVPTLVGGGGGGLLGGLAGGAAAGPPGAVAGAAIGAGAGANSLLELYRGLMGYFGGTDDTRTPGQHFTDAAVNTTLNAAGEGVGRIAAGGLRAALPVVGDAAPGVMRAVENLGGSAKDIAGMPALATGSPGLNTTIEALGNVPTATNVVEAGKQSVRDWLTKAQQRIVGNLAGTEGRTPTADTGEAMLRLQGAAKGAVGDYEGNITKLQQRMGTLGQDVSVVPYNLQNTVNSLKASVADAPGTAKAVQPALDFANDLLERSRFNSLANGRPGLSFPAVLKERTTLGGRINFPAEGERADATQQAMMAVRNAIKGDLYDAAGRVGNSNPQLLPTLTTHDQYVTAMRGGEAALTPGAAPGGYMTVQDLGKLVEKNPADAFNAVTRNAVKSGPNGGDGTELMRARNSVDSQSWREFASHYFERMFQPNPGVAQTAEQVAGTEPLQGIAGFATKWNALSPGAKRALFDGYLPPEQRQQLDSLATLANQYVRAGYDVNRSKTSNLISAGQAFTQPVSNAGMLLARGHPVAALLAGVAGVSKLAGAPVMVRLMQNPNFVRWLASSAREVAASPNRYTTALTRLGAMQFDAPTQAAVNKYIDVAQQKPGNPSGATQ